ncbi:hypothetical protein E2C01_099777 [Portunus trituberculatus]|uniref:Uncharacterized protein n=1 Tax=Portunus trituberculatus TaxID=210409 RepID=A0A5B7KBA8_PORTR|nr:hypothetical protein [Portunus trituberculatus]
MAGRQRDGRVALGAARTCRSLAMKHRNFRAATPNASLVVYCGRTEHLTRFLVNNLHAKFSVQCRGDVTHARVATRRLGAVYVASSPCVAFQTSSLRSFPTLLRPETEGYASGLLEGKREEKKGEQLSPEKEEKGEKKKKKKRKERRKSLKVQNCRIWVDGRWVVAVVRSHLPPHTCPTNEAVPVMNVEAHCGGILRRARKHEQESSVCACVLF